VISPKRGRTAVLMAEADIERSPEEVFDYRSDPVNEPEWNLKMKAIEKLTDGPVGVGPGPDGVHVGACGGHQRVCALRTPNCLGADRPVKGLDVRLERPSGTDG
jgi:hypothetical protein